MRVLVPDIARSVKFSAGQNGRVLLTDPANRLALEFVGKSGRPLLAAAAARSTEWPGSGVKRAREPSPARGAPEVKGEPRVPECEIRAEQMRDGDGRCGRRGLRDGVVQLLF